MFTFVDSLEQLKNVLNSNADIVYVKFEFRYRRWFKRRKREHIRVFSRKSLLDNPGQLRYLILEFVHNEDYGIITITDIDDAMQRIMRVINSINFVHVLQTRHQLGVNCDFIDVNEANPLITSL